MTGMNPLKLTEVAKKFGITTATLRHHLRKMGVKRFGRDWILTRENLPEIAAYIESARQTKGFQPGNSAYNRRKSLSGKG